MRANNPCVQMEFAMPVLESPEVIITPTASGLISASQKVRTDLTKAGYETDVGLNDPSGLNVLCTSVQIYNPPVSGDCRNTVRLSLFLSEAWPQKDEFLSRMQNEHKIPVREEAMAWGSPLTHITVSGQDNIREFGKHLRVSFAETAHEDATISRQIVNAALLGTAIDAMDEVVAKSQQPKESLGVTWATMDWDNSRAAQVNNYGWQP